MAVNGRFIFDKSEPVYATGTTKNLFSDRKLYCLLLIVVYLNLTSYTLQLTLPMVVGKMRNA